MIWASFCACFGICGFGHNAPQLTAESHVILLVWLCSTIRSLWSKWERQRLMVKLSFWLVRQVARCKQPPILQRGRPADRWKAAGRYVGPHGSPGTLMHWHCWLLELAGGILLLHYVINLQNPCLMLDSCREICTLRAYCDNAFMLLLSGMFCAFYVLARICCTSPTVARHQVRKQPSVHRTTPDQSEKLFLTGNRTTCLALLQAIQSGAISADKCYHLDGGVYRWFTAGLPMTGEYDTSNVGRTPNAVVDK